MSRTINFKPQRIVCKAGEPKPYELDQDSLALFMFGESEEQIRNLEGQLVFIAGRTMGSTDPSNTVDVVIDQTELPGEDEVWYVWDLRDVHQRTLDEFGSDVAAGINTVAYYYRTAWVASRVELFQTDSKVVMHSHDGMGEQALKGIAEKLRGN